VPQGKQAKILTPRQERRVLKHLETTRYPSRDRVTFLLSIKAGLRAKEIASLTWAMVTDAEGKVGEEIALTDSSSKGNGGGRTIPMHPALREALEGLQAARGEKARPDLPVIHSERGRGMSAASVAVLFHRLYRDLGLSGCSSHSGRRTFITRAAQKIVEAGGSLRDVQQLAGHANLGTTQRYIEGSAEAKRRVVALI
jgi:integrase/recombinase XerD